MTERAEKSAEKEGPDCAMCDGTNAPEMAAAAGGCEHALAADTDQPAGFPGYGETWLPPAAEAAERVLAFVSWFGDGRVNEVDTGWSHDQEPPLFARDLEAVAKAARMSSPPGRPT